MSDGGPSQGVRRAISQAEMQGPMGISVPEQNTILDVARREDGISPSEVQAAQTALNRARSQLLERLNNDPQIGPGMGHRASELTSQALEGMANNSQFDWHAIHEFSQAAELIRGYEQLVSRMQSAYDAQTGSSVGITGGDAADRRHAVSQWAQRNFNFHF